MTGIIPRLSLLLIVALIALSSIQAVYVKRDPTNPKRRLGAGTPVSRADCDNNAECLKRGLPLRKPRHLFDGIGRRATLNLPSNTPESPSVPFQPIPYPGRIQSYTIPSSGYYLLQARGASGGNSTGGTGGYGKATGGPGAVIQASVYLAKDTVLSVVVGLRGGSDPNFAGTGGGGGTFIYIPGSTRANSQPLVVAGGGGGTASSDRNNLATQSQYNGMPASLTENGSFGTSYTTGTSGGGGGTGGNGGTTGTGSQAGGAGAGFYSSGANPGAPSAATAGNADTFAQGRGQYSGNDQHGDGGFGGGGGGGGAGGGGGGGYSGGGSGGGTAYCCSPAQGQGGPGGGGGSYIVPSPYNGRAVLNPSRGINDYGDDGFVAITKVGN